MSESEDVSVGVSQLTEARMWLLSKCRSVCGSVQNAMDKGRRSDTNRASQLRSGMQSLVITPTSIPPFIIPSPENLKNRACNEDAGISTSSDSVSCSDQLSPEDGAALQVQMNRWNKSCHSEPVSPVKQPTPVSVFRRCHAISYDMLDEAPKRTNADPLSLPALSLPHLKTKTKFGFETLFESPNTNRKESLFHGNNFQARRSSLFTHGPPEPRNPEYNSAEMLNNISGTDSCMEPITRSRTRRQDVLWHVAPLGVPLVLAPTEKSEATKRSSSTSPYMIRGRTKRSTKNTVEENISDDESPQSSLHHVIRRRRRRRRQSVGGHVANKDSDTAAGSEEESSDDMMSSQRRHSSCDIHLEPSQIERLLLLSAMTSTSGAPPPPSSLLESESSSRLVNCRPVAAEGELKFVMKYHPRTRQLSVRLLRGYNIGGQHNCDMTTSPFVKLSLFPGKLQQCRTNIVKHTKNPVFNKCFYFNDIDVRQLRCTYLHMKVMNRVYQLKRDEHLGDIQVNLADADLLSEEEQKMRRELQPVLKELGRINVSLCFHAREERLDVQVLDMTELPCNGITGLPDPYVQIELGQPGRSYCTVHTKTKRKTTTATFNESFTFPMSPKIEDLNDTSLTFTVLDRETIRTDSIIGRVRLGYAATEECEFEHWNKVLQTPGKEFNKWHVLMED